MQMSAAIEMILVAVLLAIVGPPAPGGSAAQSNLTTLVYYNQTATWDEATEACGRFGGYLVHIEDDNKHAVVMATIQQLTNKTIDHIWLGQIRPTLDTTEFIWTNTCTPVTYNNWGYGQPSNDNSEQCVRVEMSSQTWETARCGSSAEIFCEHSSKKPCMYEAHEETDLDIPVTLLAENVTAKSSTECQNLCSDDDLSGNECWAASFSSLVSTGVCKLYRHQSIQAVQDYAHMVNTPGSTLWFKKCLQGVERPSVKLVSAGGEWNEYKCDTNTFWFMSEGECECPCQTLTEAERQAFIGDILSSLTINISNLSSVRRKYYSVVENDVVTLGLGYSGVIFIVITLLLIILSDVDVLIRGRSAVFKG
ncbi:uncharacterized protein LOC135469222 [Liolophura sinensis]|uniref:uncharacterized protein LOC135469222 n=1 Tax=Liolophura sinensis TaxID=3198878 RepID=UPI003158FCCA